MILSPCLTIALFNPINGTTSHTVARETKSKKFKILKIKTYGISKIIFGN